MPDERVDPVVKMYNSIRETFWCNPEYDPRLA